MITKRLLNQQLNDLKALVMSQQSLLENQSKEINALQWLASNRRFVRVEIEYGNLFSSLISVVATIFNPSTAKIEKITLFKMTNNHEKHDITNEMLYLHKDVPQYFAFVLDLGIKDHIHKTISCRIILDDPSGEIKYEVENGQYSALSGIKLNKDSFPIKL